jgi:hypothetical protein
VIECLITGIVLVHDVDVGIFRDLLGNEPDNLAGPGNELFLESGGETGDAIIPSRGRISMIQKRKSRQHWIAIAGLSYEL